MRLMELTAAALAHPDQVLQPERAAIGDVGADAFGLMSA